MRLAVIGAGFTGLTAAYRLIQKGHQVTVFEKEKKPGGLVTGFKKNGWDWSLESFFHHLFTSDRAAKKLIKELNLSEKLFYLRPKTSIFKNGSFSQFDSPLSLLTFSHLSFLEKFRAGIITAYLKLINHWQTLEKATAEDWLKKYYGQKGFQTLWQPLLKAKFGSKAKNISMAWFWARIKKRSAKLGYFEGGFQVLVDKLVEEIKKNGGRIAFNQEVKNLNELRDFDRMIVTTPISVFLKMAPKLPPAYQKQFQNLEMVGALNLVLIIKEKFLKDNIYWLNINEPGFPFVAVVEQTNFIDPKHYGDDHLLYVGGYYPQNHHYFKMKKETIFNEWLPYLQKIRSQFRRSTVRDYQLAINLHAQPVVPVNHSKLIPKMKTPIPNVFLANMQMIYPWDRGINYAIELGEKVADEVLKND